MIIKDDEVNIMKLKASQTEELLTHVKSQLDECLKQSVKAHISRLRFENLELSEEIKKLKIFLEKNGGSQVQEISSPDNKDKLIEEKRTESKNDVAKEEKAKKRAEKKEAKPAAKTSKPDTANDVIDVGRLDFRIGQIISVEKHPDADSLYVEKVDVGEPNPRTVVSGLVKHMPATDLENRTVVLLCNLKPAKMRGVTSEAMVMCASTPEKVEVLIPPEGSLPGDLVEFEGYERTPDPVLNPKKKIFETCAPDLKTDENGVAKYKDVPFVVPGKGKVVSKTLTNVQIK
ncbi:UNVERIFIED_CONTAM: hypothetical protein RMT77_015953 [Armadillidium vulgare]